MRLAEEFVDFVAAGGAVVESGDHFARQFPSLFVNSDMADGPVSRLRHDTRA